MMEIKIFNDRVPQTEIQRLAKEGYGEMVKAVLDVEREILALGGEMHADAEAALLEQGSLQKNLWGINLYPGKTPADWIEFTSFINIRPRDGNRTMELQDMVLRRKITSIIERKTRE